MKWYLGAGLSGVREELRVCSREEMGGLGVEVCWAQRSGVGVPGRVARRSFPRLQEPEVLGRAVRSEVGVGGGPARNEKVRGGA